MVSVHHATDRDLTIIGDFLAKQQGEQALVGADVVVAAEENRIIGFGVLRKGGEAGCVSLFEDSRRRGIGAVILRHLAEYAQVPKVYATRMVSYFTVSDGARLKAVHAARKRKEGDDCRGPLLQRFRLAAYGTI
jgi:GNAT superfamily N-acetyltransferase